MNECQQVFEDLKVYLSSAPLLSPSKSSEELFLYLAVSLTAVNATFVRDEDKVQKPVYFTSRAFQDAKEKYPLMEKLAFALVTIAHKLKPYFQAHTVIVQTDKPLQRAMSSPKAVGRMALWAIELSEFNVQYCPCTAIKGQAIANFIAKFTHIKGQGAREIPQWSIHMNGLSTRQAGRTGVVLRSPEGDEVKYMVRLDFPTTNNEVEYEVLIAGLDLAKAAGAPNVVVYCDSQIVTSQDNGDYECKGEWMKKYLEQVKNQVNGLQAKFVQIPREENEHANRFAKAASIKHMLISNQVLSFIQLSPLIDSINVHKIGSEND